jgi:hypothetical protein
MGPFRVQTRLLRCKSVFASREGRNSLRMRVQTSVRAKFGSAFNRLYDLFLTLFPDQDFAFT